MPPFQPLQVQGITAILYWVEETDLFHVFRENWVRDRPAASCGTDLWECLHSNPRRPLFNRPLAPSGDGVPNAARCRKMALNPPRSSRDLALRWPKRTRPDLREGDPAAC